MLLKESAQAVMWMLQQMNSSTHCSNMMEIESILDMQRFVLYPSAMEKLHLICSEVPNGKTLSCAFSYVGSFN